MSSEDPLKKIILDSDLGGAREDSSERVNKISKAVNAKDSQAKIVDFGIVKIWTVLLELIGVFYVRTQERKVENENKNKIKKN